MCIWGAGGRGNEKRSVVFAILSTLTKEKIVLYLEFHFVVKTKVVENHVRFLSNIFLDFFIGI